MNAPLNVPQDLCVRQISTLARRSFTSRRVIALVMAFCVPFVMLALGCGQDGSDPLGFVAGEGLGDGWVSLGFGDYTAVQLELDWPYLYVAAGSDGLFRKRVDTTTSAWEYMGFADTTQNLDYLGVRDVLVLDNKDILIGLRTGLPSTAGIFRSTDGGFTWTRSDSGMATYGGYASVGEVLAKSSCEDKAVWAAYHAIFGSEDNGLSWNLLFGHPSGGTGIAYDIQCHPSDCSIVWACGEGDPLVPGVAKSQDHGETWEYMLLKDVVPVVNQVYSIGLDPFDTEVAYLGMAGLVIKTTNGGSSWISPLFTPTEGRPFRGFALDDVTQNHLFIAGGEFIYETSDGGENVALLDSPNETPVVSMEYDGARQVLLVATWEDIYEYSSP